MKKLKFSFQLLFIIHYSLFIISCSTIRHELKTPLKEQGVNYLFDNLWKNDLHYKYLSAKFSATVQIAEQGEQSTEHSYSFSGIVRMLNDSIIWVSVTPALGIEAARIIITHDSVKVINRIDKTYLKSNYDFINNKLNTDFDFDMVQSLLLGNDLIYYDNDKFKAKVDDRQYKLTTVNRMKIKKFVRKSKENLQVLLQDIWLDPETFKITHTTLKEIKESRKLDVTYEDFRGINNQIFPNKLIFELQDKNPIKITIKYSRISLDEHQTFPLKIPAGYDKMNN